MNLDTRARASAQAIDRSATRLDPVAAWMICCAAGGASHSGGLPSRFALLVMVVAIWAGVALGRPTPIQPTLGPVTRFPVGPAPVSVAVTPGAAWVLNSRDSTAIRIDPGTGRCRRPSRSPIAEGQGGLVFAIFAEGRLWVVHRGGGDETAISAIDPQPARHLLPLGSAALPSRGWANRGT